MKRQEAFDTAVRGLASQGFTRATEKSGLACRYNAPGGRHCAFGWLITDVPLLSKHNGVSVSAIFNRFSGSLGMLADTLTPKFADLFEECGSQAQGVDFLQELQRAHDRAITPDSMKCLLYAFARNYGLNTKVLDEVTAPSQAEDLSGFPGATP